MTKQGEVRDWHKDMELCERMQRNEGWSVRDQIAEQPQMSIYWLQHYAAEKERVDRLESELETAYNEIEKLQKEYAHLDETAANDYDQLTAAEAREKKLREAIERYISEDMYRDDAEPFFEEVLASLYPKEEEAK